MGNNLHLRADCGPVLHLSLAKVHAGVKGNPTCTESTRHTRYPVRGIRQGFPKASLSTFFGGGGKGQFPSPPSLIFSVVLIKLEYDSFCLRGFHIFFLLLWGFFFSLLYTCFPGLWRKGHTVVYPFSFPITFYVFPIFSLSDNWKRSMGKKK